MIEKELKRNFGTEKIEEEDLIYASDIVKYYHPLQDPNDAKPADSVDN